MAFLPALLPVITAVSAGLGALGTGATALASSNAASFQADLAKQQAQQSQDQASVKAGEIARDTKQRVAATRAGAIENGLELTGSMNDLIYQTERQGHLDYLTAVYEGKVQATGQRASAQLYKRQASSALIGGALGAGAQALGAVSSYYKAKGNSINVGGT